MRCMPHRAADIYFTTLYRKSLQTPVIKDLGKEEMKLREVGGAIEILKELVFRTPAWIHSLALPVTFAGELLESALHL